jgi:dihydrofolate reductase
MHPITIVVAYNKNFIIGNQFGKVPWYIPDDLKFFKEFTMGKPCIMGRKTWESIPDKYKPLAGRESIIVTSKPEEIKELDSHMCVRPTVEMALATAKFFNREICVIGGGQIYNYFIDKNLATRVIASEIKEHLDVEGSVFFPNLKSLGWEDYIEKEYDEFNVVQYVKPLTK